MTVEQGSPTPTGQPSSLVSGRVPALPEEMILAAAKARYEWDQRIARTDSLRTWAEQTSAVRARYRDDAEDNLIAAGVAETMDAIAASTYVQPDGERTDWECPRCGVAFLVYSPNHACPGAAVE